MVANFKQLLHNHANMMGLYKMKTTRCVDSQARWTAPRPLFWKNELLLSSVQESKPPVLDGAFVFPNNFFEGERRKRCLPVFFTPVVCVSDTEPNCEEREKERESWLVWKKESIKYQVYRSGAEPGGQNPLRPTVEPDRGSWLPAFSGSSHFLFVLVVAYV